MYKLFQHNNYELKIFELLIKLGQIKNHEMVF